LIGRARLSYVLCPRRCSRRPIGRKSACSTGSQRPPWGQAQAGEGSMIAVWESPRVTPWLDRCYRVRKDTLSKKIANRGAEPCFFIFVGFSTRRLVGFGALYCHDRLLVQYLERPGHPHNCERSFIRSASCRRDLQPAGLQRGMWKVRPDDQDDHQRSCGSKAVWARVGGPLKTLPAAHRIRAANRRGLPK
jgi:hypothetical protein